MKMSRLVVTTLSLQTCLFIFSVFAAGRLAGVFRGPRISSLVGREEIRASLKRLRGRLLETETVTKIQNQGKRNKGTIKWNSPNGVVLAGELLSGAVFRDFRRYKSYHFLKLIRGQV